MPPHQAPPMGVPAFFRWISGRFHSSLAHTHTIVRTLSPMPLSPRARAEKYPKIILELIEEKPFLMGGVPARIDATKPLPQGELEFDNLYIDMNGVIHPCSHPEDHPGQPARQWRSPHNLIVASVSLSRSAVKRRRYVPQRDAIRRPRVQRRAATEGPVFGH